MPNQDVGEKVVSSLKEDFRLVGASRVHGWYAWAIVGIVFGMALGVVYVANRSLTFVDSRAAGGTMVLGIGGIGDDGAEAEMLAKEVAKDMPPPPPLIGWIGPGNISIEDIADILCRKFEDLQKSPQGLPSTLKIVAHSAGTYVAGIMLKKCPKIMVDAGMTIDILDLDPPIFPGAAGPVIKLGLKITKGLGTGKLPVTPPDPDSVGGGVLAGLGGKNPPKGTNSGGGTVTAPPPSPVAPPTAGAPLPPPTTGGGSTGAGGPGSTPQVPAPLTGAPLPPPTGGGSTGTGLGGGGGGGSTGTGSGGGVFPPGTPTPGLPSPGGVTLPPQTNGEPAGGSSPSGGTPATGGGAKGGASGGTMTGPGGGGSVSCADGYFMCYPGIYLWISGGKIKVTVVEYSGGDHDKHAVSKKDKSDLLDHIKEKIKKWVDGGDPNDGAPPRPAGSLPPPAAPSAPAPAPSAPGAPKEL